MSHVMLYQIHNLACSVSTFSRSVVFYTIVAFSCVFILTELCGFVACTLAKIYEITKHEKDAMAVDRCGKIDSLRGLKQCIIAKKYKIQ